MLHLRWRHCNKFTTLVLMYTYRYYVYYIIWKSSITYRYGTYRRVGTLYIIRYNMYRVPKNKGHSQISQKRMIFLWKVFFLIERRGKNLRKTPRTTTFYSWDVGFFPTINPPSWIEIPCLEPRNIITSSLRHKFDDFEEETQYGVILKNFSAVPN